MIAKFKGKKKIWRLKKAGKKIEKSVLQKKLGHLAVQIGYIGIYSIKNYFNYKCEYKKTN